MGTSLRRTCPHCLGKTASGVDKTKCGCTGDCKVGFELDWAYIEGAKEAAGKQINVYAYAINEGEPVCFWKMLRFLKPKLICLRRLGRTKHSIDWQSSDSDSASHAVADPSRQPYAGVRATSIASLFLANGVRLFSRVLRVLFAVASWQFVSCWWRRRLQRRCL